MSVLFRERILSEYHPYHQGKIPTFDKFPNRKGVLLFSSLDTNEELNIAAHIEREGFPTAILSTPLIQETVRLTTGPYNVLKIQDHEIPLDRIGSVWYLSGLYFPMVRGNDIPEHSFHSAEWSSAIYGLLAILNSKWMNHPTKRSILRYDALRLASRIGFRVPETIITNDKSEVDYFIKQGKNYIIKRVSQEFPSLPTGDFYPLFNEALDDNILKDPQFGVCPIMIQRKLEKNFEYRIYSINGEVIGFRFQSDNEIDWRKKGAFNLNWEMISLQPHVINQVSSLVKLLDLTYAALDFVDDFDGNLFFLEINPNGTHEFLDQISRPSISQRIASNLISMATS